MEYGDIFQRSKACWSEINDLENLQQILLDAATKNDWPNSSATMSQMQRQIPKKVEKFAIDCEE